MADNFALRKIFENATTEQLHHVAGGSIGHGCDITGELGNATNASILDYNKLRSENAVQIEKDSFSLLTELTGNKYDEVNHSINNTFGFSAGDGQDFNNSLSITTNNSMKNKDTFEYGVKLLVNKLMGAYLTPTAKGSIKDYLQNDALCHIAGKPDSKGNILYPSGTSHLKQLFCDYGTHIVTKGIFGCKYEYIMLRQNNEWESDMLTQVNLDMDNKFTYGEDRKTLNIGIENDFSESERECHKNAKAISLDRRVGGNTSESDFALWQYSCSFDKPETISLIGYDYIQNPTKSNSSVPIESGLIPIWELVDDPARKQEIEDAFHSYVEEKRIKINPYKRVIADVIAYNHPKGDAPDYLYEVDNTGGKSVTRRYVKLSEDITSHIKGTKKYHLFFYYALGYADTDGLTGIRFMDKKETSDTGWIRRGPTAHDGVTGVIKDYVVGIQKASVNGKGEIITDKNQLISGFGVLISNKHKKVSRGTNESYPWTEHGEWYYKAGLVHDSVKCITTTKEMQNF